MSVVKFLALGWLCVCAVAVQAQKENNVWVGGQYVGIDFNSGNPQLFERTGDEDIFWRTDASVCDSSGNLLFYTNGFRIYNKNYAVMQNGNNCNIGDYSQTGYNRLSVADGAVIVPKVGDPGKYYVFHTDLNWMAFDTFLLYLPLHVYYSLVDMSLNGGLGAVVAGQKDVLLLNDTITQNGMKVVKHANGRDYWLITHEAQTNRYYRYLIDPAGVHGPYTQAVGMPMQGEQCFGFSALVFTKDGAKAVQLASKPMLIDVYDFDRCTGLFSITNSFSVSDTAYYLWDAEFSASGRYLYVAANFRTYVFQFDLWAADIASSKQLIAVASGIPNPFLITFERLRLAPDDKIYIASYDGNRSLSVINFPDSAGTACGFVELEVNLYPPGINWSGMPNVVNYSLGALVGSGCDTLTSSASLPTPVLTFGVYPNPFTDQLQLTATGVTTKAFVTVTDVLGQTVYSAEAEPVNQFIHRAVDLRSYPGGVYVVRVEANGRHFAKTVVKR